MRRPGASPSRELTASALLLAAYAVLAARTTGSPGRHERRSFRLVNSRGDQPLLRLPQQLGTPWVLPGTAAVSSYARIQQGAHYPLDAVDGALLGLGLAGLLNAATAAAPTRTPALAAG